MKKTSIPLIAASALLLILLFSLGVSPAEAQTHWLVGRWDGSIEGMAAKQKPARTLRGPCRGSGQYGKGALGYYG
jgi:hypothetical protein